METDGAVDTQATVVVVPPKKSSFEQLLEFKNKGQESNDSDYLSDDEDYHENHNKGFVEGLVSTERPVSIQR